MYVARCGWYPIAICLVLLPLLAWCGVVRWRSMDKPAAAKDWEAFMVAHASATNLVSDFFGYLKSASDIPDEL